MFGLVTNFPKFDSKLLGGHEAYIFPHDTRGHLQRRAEPSYYGDTRLHRAHRSALTPCPQDAARRSTWCYHQFRNTLDSGSAPLCE